MSGPPVVLAAQVVPLDVWYLVPVGALAQGTSLRLYPDDGCKAARFEKYREGWDLFREATESHVSNGATRESADDAIAEEQTDAGDESIPPAFARWRPPAWKPPRFFGR